VLATFHLVERRFDALRRLASWKNALLFFASVLPWFLSVSRLHPDFPRYGIVEESLRRFGTGAFKRTQPFWFFLPVIAAGCLPWSVLFPAGALAAWRSRAHWTRTDRFLLVWVIAVVVFFSLSQSKLAGYVLPGVVGLAILVARAFDAAIDRPEGTAALWLRRSAWAAAGTILLVAAAFAVEAVRPGFLAATIHWRQMDSVAKKVDWLAPAIAFALGGAALAVSARRRRLRLAFAAIVLFLPFVCLVGFPAVGPSFADLSTRDVALAIEAQDPAAEVACLQSYPDGLGFYLQRTFPLFTVDGGELKSNYVRYVFHQPGPKPDNMLPLSDVDAWLDARNTPVILVGDRHQRDLLERLAAARGSHAVLLHGSWSGALIAPAGER
jgi:4-amino-4-deoxy-L-arabinose transferase-like glycosyltransferase